MKSQLKALISENISALEYDRAVTMQNITFYYNFCDKDVASESSEWNFKELNRWKSYKRRVDAKLKKLRALQCEVKKLSAYTTTKSQSDVINGKAYIVSLITTKEV